MGVGDLGVYPELWEGLSRRERILVSIYKVASPCSVRLKTGNERRGSAEAVAVLQAREAGSWPTEGWVRRWAWDRLAQCCFFSLSGWGGLQRGSLVLVCMSLKS